VRAESVALSYFSRRARVGRQFSCLVSSSASFEFVSKEFNAYVYVYAKGSPLLLLCCSRCGSAYFCADGLTSDIHNVNDYRWNWGMGHRRELVVAQTIGRSYVFILFLTRLH
jgi:hypothetical protein